MTRIASLALSAALLFGAATTYAAHHKKGEAEEKGFVSLFDGKTLKGWDGNPDFWSVKDGALTGINPEAKEKRTKGNTFLVYTGKNEGEPGKKKPVEFADFELKFSWRIKDGNSGVQYRSFKKPGKQDGWRIGGYQADFDPVNKWTGLNYGEAFRGILAPPGQKVTLLPPKGGKGKMQKKVEKIGDPNELKKDIKPFPAWHTYHVIAKGNVLTQKINGKTMSILVDEDKAARSKGLIAIQVHQGPPMMVQVRDIRIKELKGE